MKDFMFENIAQWRVCMYAAVCKFLWGLTRLLLYTVTGLLSLMRWLWQKLVKWVGNYPATAIVIAVGVFAVIWTLTFAHGRARLVTAEYQRDSLSYRLNELMRLTDTGEKLVVGDDTITIYSSYDIP